MTCIVTHNRAHRQVDGNVSARSNIGSKHAPRENLTKKFQLLWSRFGGEKYYLDGTLQRATRPFGGDSCYCRWSESVCAGRKTQSHLKTTGKFLISVWWANCLIAI